MKINAKKILSLVLSLVMVLAFALTLSACGEDEPATGDEDLAPQETGLDYKAIYKATIDDLNATSGSEIIYASLVELSGDDVPEMVVAFDDRLMVFNIDGEEAYLGYDEEIGGEFGVTDAQKRIGIGPDYVVNFHSPDVWSIEEFHVITASTDADGSTAIYTEVYQGDSFDADIPNRDELKAFYLNDLNIDRDEYLAACEKYIDAMETIDLLADNSRLIEEFMASLEN